MAKGNAGAARLAGVLQQMAHRTASSLDQDWMVLGRILPDGGLRLDDFTVDIPADGYMVLDMSSFYYMAIAAVRLITQTASTSMSTQPGGADSHTHSINAHLHDTILPPLPLDSERGREIIPGDRVLCCWVNMGTKSTAVTINPRAVDIVVIGRVYWNS